MLFTGREWLSDLKLYDYRNRLYQPELGRFMQPDPREFVAGDFNLYRYCHNDPVNKTDPTGLSPQSEAIFTTAGEAIGFLLSLPADAFEDLGSGGVLVLANPATTIAMTAGGGAIGRALDHAINGPPSLAKSDTVGSYTNTHESGKSYHGKGPEKRMNDSARRIERKNNDPAVKKEFEPAKNDKEAFKAEARRIEKDGGVQNPSNYNKINSPGKKLLDKDGPGG